MAEGKRMSGTSYWSIRRRVRRLIEQNFSENEVCVVSSNDLESDTGDTNTCTAALHDSPDNDLVFHDPPDNDSGAQNTDDGELFEMHFDNLNARDPVLGDLLETDSDENSENESEQSLKEFLREWAVRNQTPNMSLSELLGFLRIFHPELPKDPRTLLKTKVNYNILNKCGGQYYYFGIASSVSNQIKDNAASLPEQFCLKLQINIDGLPLFKSTSDQFWPILGKIQNVRNNNDVFIICLYHGLKKPDNLHEYLDDFVNEYIEVEKNGIDCFGKHLLVSIHSIICDAPARAFIKGVKSYSGYHGCDKCTQHGNWLGKVTFPETNAPLRTDQSFAQQLDEDHHLNISPLSRTSIGMVSQIPLDYMHLVCLGVMKRLLLLWIKGPFQCRLGSRDVLQISTNLVYLKDNISSEFARKPRPLSEIDRWKATEFRQFLLYTGIIALSGVIHPNIYKNFLLFFVGIHILLNERLSNEYNQYAHDLLETFVIHFYQIYGNDMAVYNVHGLVHLSGDAHMFGSLDNISAFPFENFLSKLKRMIRKPKFPLAQVVRRLSEQAEIQKTIKTFPYLTKPHNNGPIPDRLLNGCQYLKVETERYTLKVNHKDSCVRIDGKICRLQNIVSLENDIFLVYKVFQGEENFFTTPLESRLLGIVKVSNLDNILHVVKISELQSKCVILPFKTKHIAIPFTDAEW